MVEPLPEEPCDPTHQHQEGCPALWGYECECTPTPLMPPTQKRLAVVVSDGWAGRIEHPVVVTGETTKRYRIESRDGKDYTFAANRRLAAGASMLVPKRAVRFV